MPVKWKWQNNRDWQCCLLCGFFFVEFAQAENEFTIAEYRIVAEIVSKIDDLARFRNGILLQKSAGDTVSEAKKNYIGMSNIVGKAEIGFA